MCLNKGIESEGINAVILLEESLFGFMRFLWLLLGYLALLLVGQAQGLNCCAQCKSGRIYHKNVEIYTWDFLGKFSFTPLAELARICELYVSFCKPSACPVGKETPPTACKADCATCPVGQYSNGGPDGCLICPVGSRCVNGIKYACSVGTYQPSEAQTSCLQCASNLGQPNSGQTSCLPCNLASGYYSQTVGGVLMCIQCVCTGKGQMYIACQAGAQALDCRVCTGGDSDTGYTCPVGMQPSVVCDGTQTANAVCVNCPAGKQKPSKLDKWCAACPDGTYKAAQSNATCGTCTNKLPASSGVAVYGAWAAGAARTTNSCPWSCVAGYYKPASGACVACNLTAGKFALAGKTGSCSACSTKPANSAYLLPRGFDGRTDSCPW